MRIFNKSTGLLFLISLSLFLCPIVSVRGEDVDDSDEDAVINEENVNTNDDVDAQTAAETEADDEGGEDRVLSSPFVKTHVLFIKPESSELPAGRLVKMLVGFHNNGSSNFIVDSIDGSFRYPQDFSYYIQNFTQFDLNKVVEAEREATFEYMFTPSETFSSRQFGLTINLRYKSLDGKAYVNAVFNETVNIVEPDEGLDGETFFLYVFLVGIVVLVLFAIQQFFFVFKKKTRSGVKPSAVSQKVSSNGNSYKTDGVDFEWIPKEHLQTQNKSPNVSPRQRKGKSSGGLSSNSGNSSNDE